MTFTFHTEAETAAFGAKLAPLLQAGDIVLLEGPLGAGKSTLARGLVRAFCNASEVPSPTFTLVETYERADAVIWHFDLFRLEAADEVWELGLEDAMDAGVCLIEWPDKIANLLPEGSLRLRLQPQPDGARRLHIVAPNRWGPALRTAGIA